MRSHLVKGGELHKNFYKDKLSTRRRIADPEQDLGPYVSTISGTLPWTSHTNSDPSGIRGFSSFRYLSRCPFCIILFTYD